MTARKYSDYLQDILDSIENIQSFVGKYELSDFIADKKTIAAVLWNFQVLGEAAKHIPASVRAQYPDIPWDDMTGMRDKMTHAYLGSISMSYGIPSCETSQRSDPGSKGL